MELGETKSFVFSDRPTTIYCVLTKLCNMQCKYCHVCKGKDELLIEPYIERLKILLQNKPNTNIVFYGGEPLVRAKALLKIVKTLIEFYNYQTEKLEFSINTNGTLITPKLADFFNEYSIYPIISLDGKTETENFYRIYKDGTSAFSNIVNGMNLLRESKTIFGISMVLHKYNYQTIKPFFLWLKQEYSVNKIGVNLIHCNPQSVNNVDEFDDVKTIVDLVKYAYNINVEIPQYMPRINNFRKGIPNPTYCASCSKNKIILYPDCSIGRCENYLGQHFPFEEYNSMPPLKLGFINNCKNCVAFDICGGGCAPDMANDYLRNRWCRLSNALYNVAIEE